MNSQTSAKLTSTSAHLILTANIRTNQRRRIPTISSHIRMSNQTIRPIRRMWEQLTRRSLFRLIRSAPTIRWRFIQLKTLVPKRGTLSSSTRKWQTRRAESRVWVKQNSHINLLSILCHPYQSSHTFPNFLKIKPSSSWLEVSSQEASDTLILPHSNRSICLQATSTRMVSPTCKQTTISQTLRLHNSLYLWMNRTTWCNISKISNLIRTISKLRTIYSTYFSNSRIIILARALSKTKRCSINIWWSFNKMTLAQAAEVIASQLNAVGAIWPLQIVDSTREPPMEILNTRCNSPIENTCHRNRTTTSLMLIAIKTRKIIKWTEP